jgi:hypothetical protein
VQLTADAIAVSQQGGRREKSGDDNAPPFSLSEFLSHSEILSLSLSLSLSLFVFIFSLFRMLYSVFFSLF